MKSLQVREVPDVIYETLSEAARRHHRSLAQQTLYCIQQSLELDPDAVQRRKKVLAEIEKTALPENKNLSSPIDLVREDRNR